MLTAFLAYRRPYQRLTKGGFTAVSIDTATSALDFKAVFTEFTLSKPDFRAVLIRTCPLDASLTAFAAFFTGFAADAVADAFLTGSY